MLDAEGTLAVSGTTERFAIHRVYCVGRNYADHAREMGADPTREPPFFFMKPPDAAFSVGDGYRSGPPGVVPFPPQTLDLHHEVELVVALGHGGSEVRVRDALDLVWGYGVGIDLTRRDLQDTAKALGRPWDLAKGFDASAPMSDLVPVQKAPHPAAGRIELWVDDVVRQTGDLSQQIWSVAEVISSLSAYVTLRTGDLIMTGTPQGVGRLERGSQVTARIEHVGKMSFAII